MKTIYMQVDDLLTIAVDDRIKNGEPGFVQNILFMSVDDTYEYLFQKNDNKTPYYLAAIRVGMKIEDIINRVYYGKI